MGEMTCPRRAENFMRRADGPFVGAGEGLDEWHEYPNPRSHEVGVMHCSYCGSLRPEDFMSRVEAGEALCPTDKNYKAYIEPNDDKFYYQHLSDDQKKRLIELANAKKIKFSAPGYWYVRPFFVA